MNCFECARVGSDTTAVALCRTCSAGLCLDHLLEAAGDQSKGSMHHGCLHVTWNPPSGEQVAARTA